MSGAEAAEAKAPAAAGGRSPLIAIVAAVVISTMASAGISFLLIRQQLSAAAPAHGEDGEAKAAEEKVEKGPPNYIPLDPAFVVNLEGADTRFLQVQVQMMTRDPKGGEELKVHEPRIRSALLMLFSQQQPQDIATREGKEKLQADVLAEIQKIMTEETGKPLVEAVYFTSFVTQ